jgi:hypothetical protein
MLDEVCIRKEYVICIVSFLCYCKDILCPCLEVTFPGIVSSSSSSCTEHLLLNIKVCVGLDILIDITVPAFADMGMLHGEHGGLPRPLISV